VIKAKRRAAAWRVLTGLESVPLAASRQGGAKVVVACIELSTVVVDCLGETMIARFFAVSGFSYNILLSSWPLAGCRKSFVFGLNSTKSELPHPAFGHLLPVGEGVGRRLASYSDGFWLGNSLISTSLNITCIGGRRGRAGRMIPLCVADVALFRCSRRP